MEDRRAQRQAAFASQHLDASFVVPQRLRFVDAQRRVQAAVGIEAAGLVAPGQRAVQRLAAGEIAGPGDAAAEHSVLGIEGVAVAVAVRRGMAFEAQPHRDHVALAKAGLGLSEGGMAANAERAGEVGIKVGVLAAQIDVLIEQIEPGDPVRGGADASGGRREQPQFGGERGAVAQVVVRGVVAPGVESWEYPVFVVAVGDVRRGRAQVGLDVEGRPRHGELGAAVDGLLPVVAGLVGERRAHVVQRKGVVAVVGVEQAAGEVDARRIGDVDGQSPAQGRLVNVVGVASAEVVVVDEAVAAVEARHDAPGGAFGERPGRHRADAERAVASGAGVDSAFGRCRRRVGDDVDQAGQGVGPVQRALRPAQHLDLLHVVQAGHGAGAGEIHAVDDQAHRRVQRFLELAAFADAAQLQKARSGRALGEVQIGDCAEHVVQVGCRAGSDFGGAEHADAGRHVAQAVVAEGRRDDDLFDRQLPFVSGERFLGDESGGNHCQGKDCCGSCRRPCRGQKG